MTYEYRVSVNHPDAELEILDDPGGAISYKVYSKGPLPWWKRALWRVMGRS